MDPIKATLSELAIFLVKAHQYQEKYPKERSKITFALIKQSARYEKKRASEAEEINLEIDALRDKFASVDDKDNIIEVKVDVKAGKGEDSSIMRRVYKKEQKIKLDKEIKDIKDKFEEKEVEVKPPYPAEPFFLPIPDSFDFNFIEPFKKFIFNPEITDEEEEKLYLAQKSDVEEQKPTVQSVLNGQK